MKNLIFPRIFLGRVLGPLGFYLEKIPGLERRPEKGDLSTQRGEGMRGAYIGSTFFYYMCRLLFLSRIIALT